MDRERSHSPAHLSSVFWDGFDAVRAMGALARSGFSTQEYCALGILAGSVPNLEEELLELGLPESESAFLTRLFDEGAIVLVVRAHERKRRQAATRLLKQCGGVFASDAAQN